MTFATRLKEEICSNKVKRLEALAEIQSIIRYDADLKDNAIQVSFENGKVARRVYEDLKSIFNISPHIIIRTQKRMRYRTIYILEIKEEYKTILNRLNIIDKDGNLLPMRRNNLSSPSEMASFIRGAFLSVGSINDPSKSGYHLEFVFESEVDALFVSNLLHEMNFNSKVTKRKEKYMVYLKSSEEISDMIRMFESPESLFYFEDIRIYRDHKNMVNRLNNCDIANEEKTITTGKKQLEEIEYLKDNDLLDLLDDKTKHIVELRCKYPEDSYQELADKLEEEYSIKVSKSFVNHHFIKMRDLIRRHKEIDKRNE